ncbi:MAG: class I poly(R)-hydroxyalkanoic acid synthase, partial [Bauldia litoralis]
MSKQQSSKDAEADASRMAEIAERSQRILEAFLERQKAEGTGPVDPLNVTGAFLELTQKILQDPMAVWEMQTRYWQDYMDLWTRSARRFMGEEVEPAIEPPQGDRRFKDSSWTENAAYDFIKQSYLLTSRYITDAVDSVEGLDDKTAHKI